ncbi:MAG: hypothetical protein LAQ30_26205 [Acidobacteriia bacterium]|nr:hypothetical protein [Terriglobia bacterium]
MPANPRFRFYFLTIRRKHVRRIPSSIQRFGVKTVQYATALACLSDAGCREAKIGWRLLVGEIEKNQAKSVRDVLKVIERDEITPPIRLDPGARWKMDAFGLLALELLLWVWQARRNPSLYGSSACSVPKPFDGESVG